MGVATRWEPCVHWALNPISVCARAARRGLLLCHRPALDESRARGPYAPPARSRSAPRRSHSQSPAKRRQQRGWEERGRTRGRVTTPPRRSVRAGALRPAACERGTGRAARTQGIHVIADAGATHRGRGLVRRASCVLPRAVLRHDEGKGKGPAGVVNGTPPQ